MAAYGQNGTGTAAALARTRWRLRLRRFAFRLVLIAIAAWVLGFGVFVLRVPMEEVALTEKADGIVALTGGASRTNDAIELLASGRAKRLLISGVHRNTTTGEIARLMPEHERVIACCVDLDHSALNTLGNAIETRRWAEQQGFRSLIVVTSSYHMPRAMAEIAHQLPSARLMPFPVVSDTLRNEPWWSSGATAKLLLSEYLKYIYALVRMRLDPMLGEEPSSLGTTKEVGGLSRPDPGVVQPPASQPGRL
jgi:uncharacterized SAM-binding protein YcdF (DUF218 family)